MTLAKFSIFLLYRVCLLRFCLLSCTNKVVPIVKDQPSEVTHMAHHDSQEQNQAHKTKHVHLGERNTMDHDKQSDQALHFL